MTASPLNTTITHELLRRAGACFGQRELFLKTFPDGVTVTVELAKEHTHTFDFVWAAENILSRPAREQYESVERPAWEQYESVERAAREQYESVRRTAREQYAVPGTPAAEAQTERPLWSGDGSEELPVHVTRVRWHDFDPQVNGTEYAQRAADGQWYWSYDGPREVRKHGHGSWGYFTEGCPGRYTEVRDA